MQRLFFVGQAHDAHPVTGVRSNSSYPSVDSSPANTSWWQDPLLVPGSFKGGNASGHETTFDRLKVASALSVIVFPIYNYRSSLVAPMDNKFLGTYFGFEADGSLSGWAGCSYPSPFMAYFRSDTSSQAFMINSTLCPEGKFGYDARCRGWYENGKAAAQTSGNGTSMHFSPPYLFADGKIIASTATQGIADPKTGEHIGQGSVDFQQLRLLNVGLTRDQDSFHFVITCSRNRGEADTVVPPDPASPFASSAIGDLVLPYDRENSTNREEFQMRVEEMKTGKSGLHAFARTKPTNDSNLELQDEKIWLAYTPVHIRALDAVQIDDYSRGVNASRKIVYAVGVGRTFESLRKPFMQFKEDTGEKLKRDSHIHVGTTVLISLLAAAVTCRVSCSGKSRSKFEVKQIHARFSISDISCSDKTNDNTSDCCQEHQFGQNRRRHPSSVWRVERGERGVHFVCEVVQNRTRFKQRILYAKPSLVVPLCEGCVKAFHENRRS